MKKLVLSFLLVAFATISKSQSTATISSICGDNVINSNVSTLSSQSVMPTYATPGNIFDNVYDRFANTYGYQDIIIDLGAGIGNKPVQSTSTCQAGYFKVFFANGSGMETTTTASLIPIHAARRLVICQVLSDISGMINKAYAIATTTTPPTSTVFVNILVDDPYNFTAPTSPSVSGFLGVASSYYVFPPNPTSANPGIVDNQIYKTIISQQDAYDNVVAPLQATGGNGFYHGAMAFNFQNQGYAWNYTNTPCPSGQFDLYTVALHEIAHALGFASLINGTGVSKFGAINNYYGRYDLFLKDKNNQALVVSTNSCTSQYGIVFSSTPSFLGGNCSSSNPPNFTNCSNANKYVSSVNVPVYTPSCFEPPSTLSHFEDMCYQSYTNDAYFTMSNAQAPGVMKRYLQPEERQVFCDLGYSVEPTYTTTSTFGLGFSYSNTCQGQTVWGKNDGIGSNFAFTYTATAPSNITITPASVIANDATVVTTPVCIENVYAYSGTIIATSPNIVFQPNPSYYGPVLLRYIPQDGSGNKGGITYIFGYIFPSSGTCSPVFACDLVQNGGFEYHTNCGHLQAPAPSASVSTSTLSCIQSWRATPDVFSQGCTTPLAYGLFANANVSTYSSNPTFSVYTPAAASNTTFLGLAGLITNVGPYVQEAIFSPLSSSLIVGGVYNLSFWAYQFQGIYKDAAAPTSATVNCNPSSLKIPLTFGTSSVFVPFNTSNGAEYGMPTYSNSIMKINTTTLTAPYNIWTPYNINFTYTPSNNQNGVFFYLGIDAQRVGANFTTQIGPFSSLGAGTYQYMVLVDDVSIKPISVTPTFALPATSICATQSFTDLMQYVNPPGGTFTSNCGACISQPTVGFYNFTPPGTGTFTIVYTYTDQINCPQQAVAQVTVGTTSNFITVTQMSNLSCNFPNQTTLTASGGPGTYTWAPSSSTLNPFVMSPTVNSTVTVFSNVSGCNASKTVAVNVLTLAPTLSVSANFYTICLGQSTTLTATGNFTSVLWTPGNFTSTNVVVSPTVSTVYTASVTNALGCSSIATLQIVVLPGPSFSISATSTSLCPNQSATLTAVGSNPATYTWFPGPTTGTSIVVSPTVATVYTVVATNSTGCVSQKTIAVGPFNFNPTLTLSVFPSPACPNTQVTLTAVGDPTSYTWTPGGFTNPLIYFVNSTTTITVVGTNSTNCYANGTIVVTTYSAPQFFTVVATPSAICTQTPNNTTATLSVIGAPNYTWQNVFVVNSPITTTVPGSFYADATFTDGCIYTQSVSVGSTVLEASLQSTIICANSPTLDLYSLSTISSGCSFSVNGVGTSNIFGPNPTPGIYTVNIVCTASILCVNSAVATITVIAVPVTPTITTSSTLACAGGNLTLTALPTSQSTYTWQPGNFVGNPYIFVPTQTDDYTVQIGVPGCIQTATLHQDFDILTPCICINGCVNMLPQSVSVSPTSGQSYCVNQSAVILGAVTFSNSEFRIFPNRSITVVSGSTLTIAGCHLYACENMWQGIIVQQGGQLNIVPNSNGSKTSFIEDAFVAVDALPYTLATNMNNILNIDNVIFNRNQISIRIGNYEKNQNNYPFTITKSLFTSRTITFTTLNWPLTNTVKNSTNFSAVPMSNPYMDVSVYPYAFLKPPLNTTFPTNGIRANKVGFTTIPLGATFKGMTIGSNGANNFNLFDDLYEDITLENSNVTIVNCIFQKGQRFGKGQGSGGKAIVAFADEAIGGSPNNYRLQVIPGTPNGNFTNKFYDKTMCADVKAYIQTEIKNSEAYSSLNDYSLFNFINKFGGTGFNIKTYRYIMIVLESNKMYNIGNSMMISLDAGLWFVTNTGGNNRYVGKINVLNNIISRHISTPTAGEYVNIGVNIQDPFASSPVTYAPTGVYVSVFQNTITNVHNGIHASNISFCTTDITKNQISLVNEPNTFFTLPIQTGVLGTQLQFNVLMHQNKITGPTTYSPGVRSISTSLSSLMSIRCNTTSFTNRGIEFNNGQTVNAFEDNWMSSQKYGMVLDNNAVITNNLNQNVIGDITRPTDNHWTGTWSSPNFKTGTFGFSTAQNAKMWIQYTASDLDPVSSATTSGLSGYPFPDTYTHIATPSLTAQNTLLQANVTPTSVCRLETNNNNSNNSSSAQSALVSMVSGSITYANNPIETQIINRHMAYRTLKVNQYLMNNSSALINFYNSAQNNCLQALCAIEDDLMNANLPNAQTKISAFIPANNIETNYRNFYQIYLRTKDSTYNTIDSLNLITLSNQCPFTEGGVVYQARALYNIIYDGYFKFTSACEQSSANRTSFEEIANSGNDIKIILKTKVFPNPNTGKFIITFSDQKEHQNISIEVLDITGRVILKGKMNSDNEGKINVDSGIINGTYLLKVNFEDGTSDIHRLIIDK